MQTVRWLGFCVSQSMSRSLLHFFPSCENASAPYPATCTLTLLTSGRPSEGQYAGSIGGTSEPVRTVVALEGGRLGHPDGLRLEDAFPILRTEASGMFGIEVEVSTPQPRLDVGSSGCVLEVISQSQPVRFVPKKLAGRETVKREKWADTRAKAISPLAASGAGASRTGTNNNIISGIAISDGQQVPSLIVVNASAKPVTAAVFALSSRGRAGSSEGAAGEELPVASIAVGPGQTRELALSDSEFAGATSHELLSGRCQSLPFSVELRDESLPRGRAAGTEDAADSEAAEAATAIAVSDVGIFLVHRELRTKRLASVVSLDGADAWEQ